MFATDTTKAIRKLQTKSAGILDIFTSTVVDLHAVNQEIDNHIDSREAEIKRIQAEHAELHLVKGGNLKVIERINTILGNAEPSVA